MADKHPYVSGTGVLVQILDHLKKSFPANLNAEVLKKLGFAPKNESYIINTVRFLKLIDDKGARTEKAQKAFTLHDTTSFQKAFSDIVKAVYADLFSLHGGDAWSLDNPKLITFFRQTDQSSELVGTRQAGTFKALAAYAGHVDLTTATKVRMSNRDTKTSPLKRQRSSSKGATAVETPPKPQSNVGVNSGTSDSGSRNLGLTVRIEINLPASGDQETYDRIFKSIRENLLNG